MDISPLAMMQQIPKMSATVSLMMAEMSDRNLKCKKSKPHVTKFLSSLHSILEVLLYRPITYRTIRADRTLTLSVGSRTANSFAWPTRFASPKPFCRSTSDTTTTPRSFGRFVVSFQQLFSLTYTGSGRANRGCVTSSHIRCSSGDGPRCCASLSGTRRRSR